MAKTHNAYKGEKPQRQPKLLMRDGFTVGYELREQAVPETMINAEGKVVPYVPKFPDSIKGSFAAYKANTKTLLKASLYFLIFLAPMIVLLVYGYNALLAHYTYSGGNFMGNLGIGYPGEISDIHSIMLTLYNGYQMFLFYCVPAVFIISLGMAGLFNVAKKVIWNEPIKYVAKPFFDGIKRFWWKYVIFVMVGAGVLLAMGSSLVYLLGEIEMSRAGAGAYCACIFSFIIGAPILLYCLVPLTIIPSYKLSFVQLIKDSFIMLVNRFVPYLIMAAVSIIPVALLAISPILSYILYIVYVGFGCSLWAMLWTGVGHSSYLKCVYLHDITESQSKNPYAKNAKSAKQQQRQKPQTVEGKTESPENAQAQNGQGGHTSQSNNQAKKKQQGFVNPKKKKKKNG